MNKSSLLYDVVILHNMGLHLLKCVIQNFNISRLLIFMTKVRTTNGEVIVGFNDFYD